MLSPPDPVRLAVPPAPPAPVAPGFPLVATLAPVVVSVVLWLVTSSPFVLVFALLGPVVAVASLVDGRRQRRRTARREDERMATALARLEARASTAARAEVGRLRRLVPAIGETPRWETRTPIVLAGRGGRPSGVELSGGEDLEEPWRARVDELQTRLRWIPDAPCPREVDAGVTVVGPPVAAAAAARAVLLQLLAQCAPHRAALRIDPVETWTTALPHAVTAGEPGVAILECGDDRLRVTWHGQRLPGEIVLAIEPGPGATGGGALAITTATARLEAARLRVIADGLGLRPALASLPERVPLAGLLHGTRPNRVDGVDRRPGLAAAIGVDADGPVLVDLVTEGPHAVVAGTTGSGKSELLVSWVLAMAHGRSSDEVAFVLVDFKGGAAFAPLRTLPHVLGVLSDLDGRLATRGIESLRAELLRRERRLADLGARSIEEAAGLLARLVVVVDEFAAVVGARPEWHALFADLAARGRSLGIHLILCTQRPAGVVRDAVLANVAVRIALRLRERADSIAFLGTESAARLPADPRGRAVLSTPDRPERVLQVAIASPSELEPMRGLPGPAAPWCPPLPTRLPLRQLDHVESGVAIGLVDLPSEQRREPLVLHPAEGPVLVLGGRGSGRSTALATIGAASGGLRLPSDAAALWALLEEGLEVRPGEALLLDDLDRVLDRCPEDHRPELSAMLARELADAARRGAVVAATAERLPYGLAAAFGPRLLLRASTREEHVLAGGDHTGFDPERPPGSGTWRGREAQVAIAEPGDPPPLATARPRLPALVGLTGDLAIVTPAVRRLSDRLTAAGCTVQRVGEPEAVVARGVGAHVLLGDSDAWAGDWAALGRARRDLAIVLVDCDLADHRAVTRSRALPPILAPGESWLVRDGRTVRAILDLRD